MSLNHNEFELCFKRLVNKITILPGQYNHGYYLAEFLIKVEKDDTFVFKSYACNKIIGPINNEHTSTSLFKSKAVKQSLLTVYASLIANTYTFIFGFIIISLLIIGMVTR